MAKLSMIIFGMLLSMMLVTSLHAQTITCRTVVDNLKPCINYLRGGGAVPPNCCVGVRSLNSAAKTTADRQTACYCIKSAAKASSVNPNNASTLPAKCGVNLGYKISYSTDCSKIR